MTGWRQSRVIAGTVIALFLAVQLALPLSRLGREGTNRFGWQMFSLTRTVPEFVVETPTGDVEITVGDYVVVIRNELDLVTHLPPHLCVVVHDAEAVRWETGYHPC